MSKKEILKIKEKIETAQAASLKLKGLLLKREELEDTLAQLTLANQKEQVTVLKAKKIELDHFIDQVEADADHSIDLLQQQLLQNLLLMYPEQSIVLEELKKDKDYHLEVLAHIKGFQQLLEEIKQHLQEIIDIRLRIKRLGILSYIFGASPNVMIAHHLEIIHHSIFKAIDFPLLTRTSLYGGSLKILDSLSKECLTRWNYRKIDTCFTDYKGKIEELLLQWDIEEKSVQMTIELQQAKMKEWIEEMSSENDDIASETNLTKH